jgi:hypothetical protein
MRNGRAMSHKHAKRTTLVYAPHRSKSGCCGLARKFIQQRRQHIVRDVPLKLFHSSEVLPAECAACDDNSVLLIHEG